MAKKMFEQKIDGTTSFSMKLVLLIIALSILLGIWIYLDTTSDITALFLNF